MRVDQALLIEGTTKFAILCYGIFPASELNTAAEKLRLQFAGLTSHTHRLFSEDWPNGLLLNEIHVGSEGDIASVVLDTFDRMFIVGPCRAAVCMYDGAFGSYDDMLSPDLASQTYALCFSRGAPVLALDTEVLASDEWRSVIALARQRCF